MAEGRGDMEKLHYKMYKKGRIWVFAGLSLLVLHSHQLVAQADDSQPVAQPNSTVTKAADSSVTTDVTAKKVTLGHAATNQTETKTENVTATNSKSTTEDSDVPDKSTVQPEQDVDRNVDSSQDKTQLELDSNSVGTDNKDKENSSGDTGEIAKTTDYQSNSSTDVKQTTTVNSVETQKTDDTRLKSGSSNVIVSKPESNLTSNEIAVQKATQSQADLSVFGASKVTTLTSLQLRSSLLKLMAPTMIDSGHFGTSSWTLDSKGVLSLGPGEFDGTDQYVVDIPWADDTDKITAINITGPVTIKKNMTGLFSELPNLTSIDGLNELNVGDVTNMSNLFMDDSSLTTLDVSSFDTGKVENMENMFQGMVALTSLDLAKFNTQNVKYMISMFQGMTALTSLNLENFATENVVDMSGMFEADTNLATLDVSSFDTSQVNRMGGMFAGNRELLALDLSNFETPKLTAMEAMFEGDFALQSLNISSFNVSKVDDMYGVFAGDRSLVDLDLSNFEVSQSWRTQQMFDGDTNLVSLKLPNFGGAKVKDFSNMFSGDEKLRTLDLSGIDTSSAQDFYGMFANDKSLKMLDLSKFQTSTVIDMSGMFEGDSLITHLDLSNFDTSLVRGMDSMFADDVGLSRLDLSNFDTSQVKSMSSMFAGDTGLTELKLSNFDTNHLILMDSMFADDRKLASLDLSSFDTSNVKVNTDYLKGLSSLQQLTLGKKTANLTGSSLEDPAQPGHWRNVGGGTIANPTGDYQYNSAGLVANYQGPTMADTYVLTLTTAPKSEEQVITRTIDYLDGQTQQALVPTIIQKATYKRTAIVDTFANKVLGYNTTGGTNIDTTDADAAWILNGTNGLTTVRSPLLTNYDKPSLAQVNAQMTNNGVTNQKITVTYAHAIKPTIITRHVQRTITYVDQTNGQTIVPAIVQTVTFRQTMLNDAVDGALLGYDTNGDGQVDGADANQAWVVVGQNVLVAVVSPDLSQHGYKVLTKAQVEAKTVTPADINLGPIKVVVAYQHAIKPVMTQRKFMRTIIYVDQQTGQSLVDPVTQVVSYTQTAMIDQVTKQLIGYDTDQDGQVDTKNMAQAWVPNTQTEFAAVVSPNLTAQGYNKPDLAMIAMLPVSYNYIGVNPQVVTVSYSSVQVVTPVVPTERPVDPEVPVTLVHSANSDKPKQLVVPPVVTSQVTPIVVKHNYTVKNQRTVGRRVINTEPTKVVTQMPKTSGRVSKGRVASQLLLSNKVKTQLPQTNEVSDHNLLMLGLSLLGLTSLSSLVDRRRSR